MRFWLHQKGQALVLMAGLLTLLVGFTAILADLAIMINRKVELQNALDAGALAGASVLADGLNTVALTNSIMLALGIDAFFSGGASLQAIRKIQSVQNQVAQWTPRVAVATGIRTAQSQGAENCVPLNALSGKTLPALMVERAYFFPKIFGHTIPLWMKDAGKKSKGKPFGDRFLRLGGRSNGPVSWGLELLGAKDAARSHYFFSSAEAGTWGERIIGRWIIWPLPVCQFKARLTKLAVVSY